MMMGWAASIIMTAPVVALARGFSATALATTGEPRFTIVPAGVSSVLSEATIVPLGCGPTVRVVVEAPAAAASVGTVNASTNRPASGLLRKENLIWNAPVFYLRFA